MWLFADTWLTEMALFVEFEGCLWQLEDVEDKPLRTIKISNDVFVSFYPEMVTVKICCELFVWRWQGVEAFKESSFIGFDGIVKGLQAIQNRYDAEVAEAEKLLSL